MNLVELAILRNFLGSHYYQTVWEDFKSDAEIWSDYAKRTSPQTIYRLVEQLDALLKHPLETVGRFLSDAVGPSGGLYFDNLQNARMWLNRFRTYLLSTAGHRSDCGVASG